MIEGKKLSIPDTVELATRLSSLMQRLPNVLLQLIFSSILKIPQTASFEVLVKALLWLCKHNQLALDGKEARKAMFKLYAILNQKELQ